ncbi:HFX_2341 family transcriptional regulator domain-containing protein [Methanoculleus oceani]|uniref:Transcriptional regulator n=1 Tax=Methanoculleus oceani TaxID=2184756 RepID=A0ABD4TD32_9EURY|nr:DUF6293 family protein [Methanoculleus sp. CWC-02]MCM2466125.1 transcriptional regulator [Methanoculleus sp. CWC-02]
MAGMEKIVHIIPLGHEYDRAVKPFEDSSADRVYILTRWHDPSAAMKMVDDQRYYASKVKEALEKREIDVKCESVNLFDFLEVTKSISKIIVKEKAEGNRIRMNMSAAGRLTSVAATLVGMHHDVQVYYVHADNYPDDPDERQKHGLSVCDSNKIAYLTNLKFDMPDPIGMNILAFLCEKGKKVNTRELLGRLKELQVEGFQELFYDDIDLVDDDKRKNSQYGAIVEKRTRQSRQLMKLNKTILEKLETRGYIRREKIGRNVYISITDTGTYVAYLSGLVD